MIILSAVDGKIVAEVPIGDRCDGVVYDPKSRTAFSSNGEGTITAVKENADGTYFVSETIKSEKGARTITIDPKTHHIFTISAEFGETPPKTVENPRPRPKVIPNSFMVLEFGN